jgi:lysophospholipase L1-like esterase
VEASRRLGYFQREFRHWVDMTVIPGLHLGDLLELRESMRSWCQRTFRDFVDTWDVLADRPSLFSDGLHPTAEGHRLLAEAVGNVWAAKIASAGMRMIPAACSPPRIAPQRPIDE